LDVIVGPDKLFYAFHPDLEPAVAIGQGDVVRLRTLDAGGGQLRSPDDSLEGIDWNQVNPATGPVYVQGTRPGDILRVDILDLTVGDGSVMMAIPGEGALGDLLTAQETLILPHDDQDILFRDRIRIPKRPMVGVIGVAPATGSVSTGIPGPHGGNMDCSLVTVGASLYFSVGVPGALMGAGDVHAAMGDGEVMICGAETAAEVVLRAQAVSLKGLPTPFLRTSHVLASIFSAPTLDEAADGAAHAMAEFLIRMVGIPVNDAVALMSLVGDLRICQVVDPLKTARFELPSWVPTQYGFTML
jgi:amidase